MIDESFGRRFLGATLPEAPRIIQRERAGTFDKIDALLADFLALLLGQDGPNSSTNADAIACLCAGNVSVLSSSSRETIKELFDRDSMAKRGAWFIPDLKRIDVGWFLFASFQQRQSRFATASVKDLKLKVERLDREMLFLWAAALPLVDLLWAPFRFRGSETGTKIDAEDWRRVVELYALMAVPNAALAPLLPRRGWSRLDAAQRRQFRDELFDAVLPVLKTGEAVRSVRTIHLRDLAIRHYKCAKAGSALRRKVLSKPFHSTLVAYFAGGWLEWLAWLAEPPHPDEEVIEVLPSTKIFVGTNEDVSRKVDAAAAATGSSVSRVAEVLAALQGTSGARSPIDDRLDAVRQFWDGIQNVSRAHAVSDGPLWGLVGERYFRLAGGLRGMLGDPDDGIADRLLPRPLLERIDDLWSTCVLERWPDGLVFESFPRAAMAEAFGPALKFWHETSLTAWFVSEGPFSRSSLGGLKDHSRKLLRELEELGAPIPSLLFEQLAAAEAARGQAEQLWDKTDDQGDGLSFAMSAGTRLGGYVDFRDIIARHSFDWTMQHFSGYLRQRWERAIVTVQKEFHRRVADKGKPPTPKQFATIGADVANQWFAGDLSRLAAAIGAKSPVAQTRRTPKLRGTATSFARRVYLRLLRSSDPADSMNAAAASAHYAKQAVEVVQQWEAMGTMPDFADGGARRVDYLRDRVFGDISPELAWMKYLEVIAEEATRD